MQGPVIFPRPPFGIARIAMNGILSDMQRTSSRVKLHNCSGICGTSS